jgi:predicted RNase H-like HicB family nuclease
MGLTSKRSCFDCTVYSGSKTFPHPALFIRRRWGDRRKGPRQFPRAAACSRLLRTLRADFVALRTWLSQTEEGYSVCCPGLPGCWSQGTTEEEALANIRDAIHEYLEVARQLASGSLAREVDVSA